MNSTFYRYAAYKNINEVKYKSKQILPGTTATSEAARLRNTISFTAETGKYALQKKYVSYFFFNKDIHIVHDDNFKRHGHYQKWTYFYSRLLGINEKLNAYWLPYFGYHKSIQFTTTDEYFFIYFKYLLSKFADYFTLSWLILYMKQRRQLLPVFIRGIRYLKRLPSRGQRTRSNYSTVSNSTLVTTYEHFKRNVNKQTLHLIYPS